MDLKTSCRSLNGLAFFLMEADNMFGRHAPPLPSSTPLAVMLRMPKPPQPRFPQFSSSASAVSKRRPLSQRLVVFSLSGTSVENENPEFKDNGTDMWNRDGIARVHGMSNVQAEELVE